MLRKSLLSIVVAAGILAPASAFALPSDTTIGQQGQLVVSAERLFGLNFWSTKTKENIDSTDKGTTFSLLTPGNGDHLALVPRIAVDYLPIDTLTVGGSLGFWNTSLKRKDEGNGVSQETDIGSTRGFFLSPRVGGAIPIHDIITVWPRGGLTFYSLKGSSPDGKSSSTLSGLTVDLECAFTFMPIPHLGFSLTPNVMLPLSGTKKDEGQVGGVTNSTEHDVTMMNFGLSAGILGVF